MSEALTMACQNDWLDSTAPTLTGSVSAGNCAITTITNADSNSVSWWYYDGYRYPYYPLAFTYALPDPRPIKLTLSEVERLRKAAKDDPKIKAILNKFTAQIEITVDF